MYGLFVEHYQKYQTIWNGNGGRTYFYQNEMPYDPPNQAAWMNGGTQGYAAYKVADSVTTHEAWGLGSYCFFNANPSRGRRRAFEVPNTPGVRFHNMVTVSLGGTGTIPHVINNRGGPANSVGERRQCDQLPVGPPVRIGPQPRTAGTARSRSSGAAAAPAAHATGSTSRNRRPRGPR